MAQEVLLILSLRACEQRFRYGHLAKEKETHGKERIDCLSTEYRYKDCQEIYIRNHACDAVFTFGDAARVQELRGHIGGSVSSFWIKN